MEGLVSFIVGRFISLTMCSILEKLFSISWIVVWPFSKKEWLLISSFQSISVEDS